MRDFKKRNSIAIVLLLVVSIILLIHFRIPSFRFRFFEEVYFESLPYFSIDIVPFRQLTNQISHSGNQAIVRSILKIVCFIGVGFLIDMNYDFIEPQIKRQHYYVIFSALYVFIFEIANAVFNRYVNITIDNIIFYSVGFLIAWFIYPLIKTKKK